MNAYTNCIDWEAPNDRSTPPLIQILNGPIRMDVEAANILRMHPDAPAAFIPFFFRQSSISARIENHR